MGNFRKPLEMKILSIFATIAFADDETPHDPEAMAFCQGKPDGFYPNVKDCQSYFFCWGNGRYGDKMYCAPSTTWNDRLKNCNYPYCLPYDNECYQPCYTCDGWTQEEIWEQCEN